MRTLLLGIDGGGTKTECALCDETGRVLARSVAGPSNPNGQTPEAAFANLRAALCKALEGYGSLSAPVRVFAGVAGCAAPERKAALAAYLREALPGALSIRNDSDAVNCLSCGVGAGADGVIAISGTGSSCFARRSGEMLRVGGWGYFFRDEGSGFEMGREALICAMRQRDGRAAPTLLTEICEKRLGTDLADGLARLYEGGRTLIASFSRCVSEAFERGDEAARDILERNAQGMAGQIRVAAGLLSPGDRPVVLAGSLWRAIPWYRERVIALCGPDLRFVEPRRAPVYGAVAEAAADGGVAADEAFGRAFDGRARRETP